ncbi:alpha/beta fold hydrolase [Nocardia sp. NPDC050413]|uniref:alpha/beta hydrolase family protein n=1 Tax=Nocardia sp. NPDC050413 TaxID=3155784 RepID=UPI0033E45AB0
MNRMPSGAVAHWFPSAPGLPVLVVLPAMGVAARHYQRFAETSQAQGFSVLNLDYRGQGDSTVRITRGVRFGYADVVDDVTEAIDWAREQGSGPVLLVGHSLGGQLVTALESLSPGRFDGLVLAAAGTPHWRAFTGRDRLIPLILPPVFAATARVRGYFDDRRFGFGRQSTQLIEDWARMARTGSWSSSPIVLARRRFPLLALSFRDDHLAPATAVDALVALFPGATTTRTHLEAPTGHTGWLKRPDAVVDAVAQWVSKAFKPEIASANDPRE